MSSSPFMLRVEGTDLPLPHGQFRIGRSSDCDLVLADRQVSRVHAILHVTADGVSLRDNDSHNGIWIEGQRTTGTVQLSVEEPFRIGSTQLVLLEDRRPWWERASTQVLRVDECFPDEAEQPEDTTSRGQTWSSFSGVLQYCEQALAEQNKRTIERAALNFRRQIRDGLLEREPPGEEQLDRLESLAFEALEATGSLSWLDCLWLVWSHLRRPPTASFVEKIQQRAPADELALSTFLRTYIRRLQRDDSSLTRSQTESLRALERLARS